MKTSFKAIQSFRQKLTEARKRNLDLTKKIRRRHDAEMQLKISSKLTTRNQIELTTRNQIEFTARNQINQLNQICLIDIANPTFFECILKMLNMIKNSPRRIWVSSHPWPLWLLNIQQHILTWVFVSFKDLPDQQSENLSIEDATQLFNFVVSFHNNDHFLVENLLVDNICRRLRDWRAVCSETAQLVISRW